MQMRTPLYSANLKSRLHILLCLYASHVLLLHWQLVIPHCPCSITSTVNSNVGCAHVRHTEALHYMSNTVQGHLNADLICLDAAHWDLQRLNMDVTVKTIFHRWNYVVCGSTPAGRSDGNTLTGAATQPRVAVFLWLGHGMSFAVRFISTWMLYADKNT
jgi:hypothetical protein